MDIKMEKKGSWFSKVKRALSRASKEKKDQKTDKSKQRWLQKQKSLDAISFLEQSPLEVLAQPLTIEDVKQNNIENESSNRDDSNAAEAAIAAVEPPAAVAENVHSIFCSSGKPKEEIAAIMIQSAFRGYMARRALRALKGLVRLRTLVQGQSIKQQVASTLKCMQSIARVQSEIRARRIRISEENRALQRQLQQKWKNEKLSASMDEEWDDSTKSKAQIEAKLLNKQEAAMRRERALAYAFTHQQTWKNSSKAVTPTFMDPNNPHWGWSWLERWMEARPWEAPSTLNHIFIRSVASHSLVGEESKFYAGRDMNLHSKPSPRTPSPRSSQLHRQRSLSTSSKALLSSSSGKKKVKSASLRVSGYNAEDDSSKSILSVKSEFHRRRHSIAGSSSIRDDESIVSSSPSVRSYVTSSNTARARSRLSSSSVKAKKESNTSGSEMKELMTDDARPTDSAKKRLSFTASPAQPRTSKHG